MDFKEEIMNKAESIKKDTVPNPKGSGTKKRKEGKIQSATQPAAQEQASYPIRLLKASEIECRVGKVCETGVSLLLYKDARVDQKILDETFGMFGWKRSHQLMDGTLYCTVAVYDEKTGQWIDKQDVGIAGFSEKEKAQASDSFKRACFNWGIGRELYTAPFIWIAREKTNIQQTNGKLCCKDTFHVAAIGYNADREINQLVISNKRGEKVYCMGMAPESSTYNSKTYDNGKKYRLSANKLMILTQEMERTGIDLEQIQERYAFDEVDTMPEAVYRKIISALSKTPDAHVA